MAITRAARPQARAALIGAGSAQEQAAAGGQAQPQGTAQMRGGHRHVVLHMPVDVRSVSLAVIAAMLALVAMRWAADVMVPLMMALLFSYALAPVVSRLARWHVPRAVGAALVMGAIGAALAWSAYALSDQAQSLVDSLPEAAQKVRDTLRPAHAHTPETSPLSQMQRAAVTLAQATADGSADHAPPGVAKVEIVKPFSVQEYLFAGTLRAATLVGQAVTAACITYFLLVAGDTFRRKMARIAGPSLAKRRLTVQALDEISGQIQRYLRVQVFISGGMGVATGLAFAAMGMNNAGVWGVLAGFANLVPYVGTASLCAASAIVALLQFGTLKMALAVIGVTVALHVISSSLVTPWLTSRACRLNAVVVFVGVLAWGWLWGVPGLLLGTPILMAVKAICDRVDDLRPIGELLGGETEAPPRSASFTQPS